MVLHFLRSMIPGADPLSLILGLNPGNAGFNYHDPAACLLRDGKLVAAVEEERLVRIKSAPGRFPAAAIKACLQAIGATVDEVDPIAVGYDPSLVRGRLELELEVAARTLTRRARRSSYGRDHVWREDVRGTIATLEKLLARTEMFASEELAADFIRERVGSTEAAVRFYAHHEAHAATAAFAAGPARSVVFVIDGMGEAECASAWKVDGLTLERLDRIDIPNSLGYFFAAITEFLGFKGWLGEGQTMALAAYGAYHPDITRRLSAVVEVSDTGFDVSRLVEPCLGEGLSLDVSAANSCLTDLFATEPRRAVEPITDQHRNIAWAAQDVLERAVIAFMSRHAGVHGGRIGFAGG